jgi:carboxylesterase
MITKADFRMEGGDAGVLLIHGLTGTPTEMRWVGQGLNRAGFTVVGMQLAGHCGDEEDLIATGWRDWVQSVRDAIDRFRPTVRHLFVAGLSMGAVLALKLAVERPEQIDGLGLYGVSFRYDGWSIPRISRWSACLLPLARPLGIGRHRRFLEQPPYGIKDERLRNFIFERMSGGDSVAAGLIGNPWYSLADMYQLCGIVRRELPLVRVPAIVIHAANDDIANVRNAQLVVDRIDAPSELVLLENSYHMITIDRERNVVSGRSADFFDRVVAGTMLSH